MKYVNRNIELAIIKAAKQFPAIIVAGPRQSGKTTLLKHLFSKTHKYVSLDNPDVRLLANKEPGFFLENYSPPVIIDEIQYAPGLFSFLKIFIDDNRSKKGQFLLTGSQSFPLMANVTESLAGRIAVFTLLSFSIRELSKKTTNINLDYLKKIAIRGGFPEVALNMKVDSKLWFNGYLQTYLERDIRQLRRIGDLTDFQRFLELLAGLCAQVLNYSEISSDLGVVVNTVKSWVSVLEASNQIILVKPFYKNKGKRIIKSPKVYFMDTGFLCFLNGIIYKEQVFKGPLSGRLFENIVLGEIIRNFHAKGEVPRIYWWRTSHGQEVDFVVEREGKIQAIEVKMTSKANRNLIKSLESFCELFSTEVDRGYLVNLSSDSVKMGKKVIIQPLSVFVNQIWRDKA